MTQPQVRATFCNSIIIIIIIIIVIIIGSTALGGPWPPLCKLSLTIYNKEFNQLDATIGNLLTFQS